MLTLWHQPISTDQNSGVRWRSSARCPERQVRVLFSARTVTAYQAYRPEIADRALATGTFVPPFRLGRMTWIKPSFLWMMYRSGWAAKPGQELVLAERINRHVSSGDLAAARAEMPAERVYPLPRSIRTRIGASPALPAAQALLATRMISSNVFTFPITCGPAGAHQPVRACIRSGLRAPLYR